MKDKKAIVWQIWLLNCAISKNGSNEVAIELGVEQFLMVIELSEVQFV